MKATNPFWSLWGGPIAMAVLTTTGLATALVSDTWGDWWSWVGLGVPVAVMGWFSWPRTASAAPAHHIPTSTTSAPIGANTSIVSTHGDDRNAPARSASL